MIRNQQENAQPTETQNLTPNYPLFSEEKSVVSQTDYSVTLSSKVKVLRDMENGFTELFSIPVVTPHTVDIELYHVDKQEALKTGIVNHLKNCMKIAKFYKVHDHKTVEQLVKEDKLSFEGSYKTNEILFRY